MLHHEASTFVMSIGRSCLSSPAAKIDIGGERLGISDSPGCEGELIAAAKKWDAEQPQSITAVPISPADRGKATTQLQKDYGAVITSFFEFKECPCIVLSGPDAQTASTSLTGPSILPPKKH